MEFREGRDSIQQGGARQGGVAAFKCGIVRLKVGFAPGAMTVVIAVGRAARATAESTTNSQNVILVVRHVAAAASKTRKPGGSTPAPLQVRAKARLAQGSLGFAGKKKLLFYIYAVIVKQIFYKRSSNYYSRRLPLAWSIAGVAPCVSPAPRW